jgi:hypothetical protein
MVAFLHCRRRCRTDTDPRAQRANDLLWSRIGERGSGAPAPGPSRPTGLPLDAPALCLSACPAMIVAGL